MNNHYFRVWSPEMAYDLGYIAADATLYETGTLKLDLSRVDEQILLGIHDRLGSHHTITRYSRPSPKSGKVYDYTRTQIHCPIVVQDLKDLHGMCPRKSYLLMNLPIMEDVFLPHFSRGYLDGDGSVKQRTTRNALEVAFDGDHNFVCQLQDSIVRILGVSRNKPSQSQISEKVWRIFWGEKVDLVKLLGWLYPLGTYPFLTRKRKTLESYVQSLPDNLVAKKTSSTGYRGVNKKNSVGRHQSFICRFKKWFYLGAYLLPEEAAYAYNVALPFVGGLEKQRNEIVELIQEGRKREIEVQVRKFLQKHKELVIS